MTKLKLTSSMFTIALGSLSFVATIASGQVTKPATVDHASKSLDAAAKSTDASAKGEAAATKADATTKVKKRITKAKAATGELGDETLVNGSATNFGGGSKQEPKPGPYAAEISGNFAFESASGTEKNAELDATKTSGTTIDFSTTYQFIFGKFSLGPVLGYSTTSTKQTATDTTTTTTSTATGFGIKAQAFFADINSDKLVPFAGLGYMITSGSTKSSSSSEYATESKANTSGNEANILLGAKYFLVRHVSIEPALAYRMSTTTLKNPDADSSTKTTSNAIRLIAGLSIFL